jgi:hypothetical protein
MKTAHRFLGIQSRVAQMCLIVASLCSWTAGQNPETQETPSAKDTPVGIRVDSARKTSELDNPLPTEKTPGVEGGGYEIKQTVEFGGRIVGFGGSRTMWSTLVNLDSGPRLLEQSLDMHSPAHTGVLFDDLSFSNYGYGGDPNNLTRLRLVKGATYNFNALFRRDKNFFGYDLLANPLNPSNSVPNSPYLISPHQLAITRRMSDFTLGLFAVSPIRLKLGYSRTVQDGSALTTIHQGTETILNSPVSNTLNNYQFEVSFRFIPRTSLNYDQFYSYFKNDNSYQINGLPLALAGGTPVDLGVVFNSVAAQPCSPIFQGSFVNPACNAYFAYSRVSPTRTSYPTEQFSFQSNYFRKLDLSGRLIYSSSSLDRLLYTENFNGFSSRTRQRAYGLADLVPASARRINTTADLGLTFHVTDRFRVVDMFRFDNPRIPGGWTLQNSSLFGLSLTNAPNTFNPASCPGPAFNAPTCPQHNTSSGADLTTEEFTNFLGHNQKLNTFEVEYDFTRRITSYLGFRYLRRDITIRAANVSQLTFFPNTARRGACAVPAGTVDANGVCTVSTSDSEEDTIEINGYSGLFGVAAHPTDHLRVNFDTELYYADNTFTRIAPRHLQLYRVRATYTPKDWVNFGTSIYIQNNSNNTADIGNKQHNRSYSFSTVLAPQGRWSLDLNYDYNDIASQTNICFVTTPSPPVAITCGGAPFASGLSFYSDTTNFGSGAVLFRPMNRITAGFGYTITSSVGSTLILNPNAPTGPLSFNYHLPMATLAIELNKHFTYKTGWNYYDYNEKSDPGPTAPRDTHGNVFTLSLRYTM